MSLLDKTIDQLMDERKRAEELGMEQKTEDALLLLKLLLEDVRRNPAKYAARPGSETPPRYARHIYDQKLAR